MSKSNEKTFYGVSWKTKDGTSKKEWFSTVQDRTDFIASERSKEEVKKNSFRLEIKKK